MAEIFSPELHFVLVHGIGGGGWCWYKIKSLMENCGYKVTCLDLKSAGTDSADPNSVLTFDDYNQPLTDLLSHMPQNEKIILVGHSAGGLSLTHAIHKFGKKIHLAIYVAAAMLRSGFLTEEDVKNGSPNPSDFEGIFELGFGQGPNEPPTSAIVKKEFQRMIFYHLSPHEDSTLASMLIKPAPIRAIQSAKFVEGQDDEVDQVRRIYIKAMQDQGVKPEQQDAMIKNWPPSDVYTLESDHSPMFSTPFLLFGLLIKAVASTQI